MIARAHQAPVPVITLTDEELAALDGGPDAAPVAPQPWLDSRDRETRKLICQVALRGLVARGLVVPVGSGDNDLLSVAVHQDLRAVLVMRHTARAFVLAQQRTDSGFRARMLYLHDDDGVLEDDISPGGLHGLTVTTRESAVARLASFADPVDGARRTSSAQPHTVLLAEIAAGSGIPNVDKARCVTTVARLGAATGSEADQERLTVYALDDRVVVAEPTASRDGELALNVTDVSADELQRRLGILAGLKLDA